MLIADELAQQVNDAFQPAAPLTFADAWLAILCYTMQIYFDFSGYTDMALGMAQMMNIRLPQNFDSPYRQRNLQEFWRHWHMTLTRFLRDYVYIPLGGNRARRGVDRARDRRHVPAGRPLARRQLDLRRVGPR